jgi:nucleotide-binding universal stress UspA family protein
MEEEGSLPQDLLVRRRAKKEPARDLLKELEVGYNLVFLGLDDNTDLLRGELEEFLVSFRGVVAFVHAKGQPVLDSHLDILVPTGGAERSRRAAEVAIAIAKGVSASVTALHVLPPAGESLLFGGDRTLRRTGVELVSGIQRLGTREKVSVRRRLRSHRQPEVAILQELQTGSHHLLMLGVELKSSERLYFGNTSEVIMERLPCSAVFVA